MKINKKIVTSSLSAILMLTNTILVSADFADTDSVSSTETQFADTNQVGTIDEQFSTMGIDKNSLSVNDTSTNDNAATDWETFKNNASLEMGNNETHASLDHSDFSENMDSFLNSAGFDYDEFNSQKFQLPDMSELVSAADLREQYVSMLSDFSSFGFGQKMAAPDNSGYSMNVIASFQDSFGKGLVTDFSEYEFTFDPSDIFNNASATRDQLFVNAYNSSDYQIVSNNLNVTAAMNKINAYSIDPSQINTSMRSIDTLKNSINSYYTIDQDKNKGEYNSLKEIDKSDFFEKELQVQNIKTALEEQTDGWFVKHYSEYIPNTVRATMHDAAGNEYETQISTGTGEYISKDIDPRTYSQSKIDLYTEMGDLYYNWYTYHPKSKVLNEKVQEAEVANPATGETQTIGEHYEDALEEVEDFTMTESNDSSSDSSSDDSSSDDTSHQAPTQ